MKLDVIRYSSQHESTLGLLFIDGKFECYTLEDEERSVKVFGETRIPKGSYDIRFRKEGGHNARYSKKFGVDHMGMLEVKDVPNFKYVLIHIGNTDDDTAGCLLVGNTANNNKIKDGFIGDSTGAYKSMYRKVAVELIKGNKVKINYHDGIIL